eukprot:3780253-Pleurochrysis_carterae.AAC.1
MRLQACMDEHSTISRGAQEEKTDCIPKRCNELLTKRRRPAHACHGKTTFKRKHPDKSAWRRRREKQDNSSA